MKKPIKKILRRIARLLLQDKNYYVFCTKCGLYEIDKTHCIQTLLKKNQIFIDVGAHYGYFSKLASEIVGKQGQVYSFEPCEQNLIELKKNMTNSNYIIYQYAASNADSYRTKKI